MQACLAISREGRSTIAEKREPGSAGGIAESGGEVPIAGNGEGRSTIAETGEAVPWFSFPLLPSAFPLLFRRCAIGG